jgi:hypothetical protein
MAPDGLTLWRLFSGGMMRFDRQVEDVCGTFVSVVATRSRRFCVRVLCLSLRGFEVLVV